MEDFARCPYCGIKLDYDDTIDSDFYTGAYQDLVEGHCPKCQKTFKWLEIYQFNRVEEIQEVRKEENE